MYNRKNVITRQAFRQMACDFVRVCVVFCVCLQPPACVSFNVHLSAGENKRWFAQTAALLTLHLGDDRFECRVTADYPNTGDT